MKHFHPLSFALGLASGIVVLLLTLGGIRLAGIGGGSRAFPASDGRGGQRFQGGNFNGGRMAERLGMTEEELQRELASGKTFQQIATERGVELPAGGQRRGTGATLPSPSSPAASAS